MAGRTEREDRIREILRVCRKNKWTFDTPNMAGRLERILAPVGFTRETTRDYVYAIMDLLAVDKQSRKQVSSRLVSGTSLFSDFVAPTSKARRHAVGSRSMPGTTSQVAPPKKSRKNAPQTRESLTSGSQLLGPRSTRLLALHQTSPRSSVGS